MTSLFVRNLQPPQYEPAHTAQQIVTWYTPRPRVGLWGLLIALPLAVLVIGCTTLARRWKDDIDCGRPLGMLSQQSARTWRRFWWLELR
jgi:hypothetical protein